MGKIQLQQHTMTSYEFTQQSQTMLGDFDHTKPVVQCPWSYHHKILFSIICYILSSSKYR